MNTNLLYRFLEKAIIEDRSKGISREQLLAGFTYYLSQATPGSSVNANSFLSSVEMYLFAKGYKFTVDKTRARVLIWGIGFSSTELDQFVEWLTYGLAASPVGDELASQNFDRFFSEETKQV